MRRSSVAVILAITLVVSLSSGLGHTAIPVEDMASTTIRWLII